MNIEFDAPYVSIIMKEMEACINIFSNPIVSMVLCTIALTMSAASCRMQNAHLTPCNFKGCANKRKHTGNLIYFISTQIFYRNVPVERKVFKKKKRCLNSTFFDNIISNYISRDRNEGQTITEQHLKKLINNLNA